MGYVKDERCTRAISLNRWLCNWTLTFLFITSNFAESISPPACEVFCQGKLLDVVQRSEIFNDSKVFVDMKMKKPPHKILTAFDRVMKETREHPSKMEIRRFIRRYFASPGSEFRNVKPVDWREKPKFLRRIADRNVRMWAQELHALWAQVFKVVNIHVRKNPQLYSAIYVPNPVILSGKRYKEFYYWDTYWMILGLLRSEMFTTVKGMIENYLILVDTYGFVPNSGRIYSLDRSNVPLLIPMVKAYYSVTKDKRFIEKHINTLNKEFDFWLFTHTVSIKYGNTTMVAARYVVNSTGPRPEAYLADVKAATVLSSAEEKNTLYTEMRAACESGWDFSSRWYVKRSSRTGTIADTKTSQIIPVDLNAILCWNARLLSEFYEAIENNERKSYYQNVAHMFMNIIQDLLWSEDDGVWFDYDYLSQLKRKYYYASNLIPLWTKCYDTSGTNAISISKRVVSYLEREGMTRFEGGVPSSLLNSGEHWDFPNCFPPIQLIIILGLKNTGNGEATDLAYRFATNWIRTNYHGYRFWKQMFSKYHAENIGEYGYGDRYGPHEGFGWTNGVCIELLYHYGKNLTYDELSRAESCAPLRRFRSLMVHTIVWTLSGLFYFQLTY